MRYRYPLFACTLAGWLVTALADPPATPAPASPPAAANAAATQAETHAQTPASAAEHPAATEAADAEEKRLRTAGYKPQVVNGVKVWCRVENSLGSRLSQQKNCGTAEDLARSVRETQNRIEATQNREWNPTFH